MNIDFLLFQPPSQPTYDARLKDLIFVSKHPCLYINKGFEKTCLYFHGNACDLGQIALRLADYSKGLKMNIFALDYPGYGLNKTGKSNETNINNAVKIAMTYLQTQNVKASDIMIFGNSLGTGPAVYLAHKMEKEGTPVWALILKSPYRSIKGIVRSRGWCLSMFSWFMENQWDSESLMKSVEDTPTCILACNSDQVIYESCSRSVHDACKSYPKEIKTFDGHGHVGWKCYIVDEIAFFLLKLKN